MHNFTLPNVGNSNVDFLFSTLSLSTLLNIIIFFSNIIFHLRDIWSDRAKSNTVQNIIFHGVAIFLFHSTLSNIQCNSFFFLLTTNRIVIHLLYTGFYKEFIYYVSQLNRQVIFTQIHFFLFLKLRQIYIFDMRDPSYILQIFYINTCSTHLSDTQTKSGTIIKLVIARERIS